MLLSIKEEEVNACACVIGGLARAHDLCKIDHTKCNSVLARSHLLFIAWCLLVFLFVESLKLRRSTTGESESAGMENRTLLRNLRQPPKPSAPVLVVSKLIMLCIPIAEITLGVLYLNECPVQRYIPIYVLVSGVFTVCLSLLSCLPCAQEKDGEPQNLLSSICTAWNSLLTLFLFCWFIAGNVWIYSVYAPSYDRNDGDKYCHKTLYLFAFWLTTLVYIVIGLLLVGGLVALICMALCGRSGFGRGFDDL